MSDILKPGDWVASGEERFTVVKELGEGGQGRVYCVKSGEDLFALKWYNKTSSTKEQYEAIETLIDKGAPSDHFVWPMRLVEGASSDHFGYIMPLIKTHRFKKLALYFSGEEKVERFEVLIDACLQMSEAFHALHLNGLCYRDISFGNLFVDLKTGDVQICDNDNVTFDSLTSTDDIWGTNGFMAPEVVRGEAPPSSLTDLYALSVVIFRMLHLQHPLQGQKEYDVVITDYESELELYGKNPIFIYDPIDATNRPVKGKKDMADAFWPYYPEALKEKFIKAFTEGLHNPHERIRETEWLKTLALLKGQLYYCYSCEKQLFYAPTQLSERHHCPNCGEEVRVMPPRLKVGDRVLVLPHDGKLYASQIHEERLLDHSELVAQVEVHPDHPKVWGLRNLSSDVWRYFLKDGTVKEVYKGDVVPIVHEQDIVFGQVTGTIRAMCSK